jgi:hypothetical protein
VFCHVVGAGDGVRHRQPTQQRHGRPIEPDAQVSTFLRNVHAWFVVMLAARMQHDTTAEYLNHLVIR